MAAGIGMRMAGCPPPAVVWIFVSAALISVCGMMFVGGKHKKSQCSTIVHRVFIFLILFFIGYFSTYIHDSYDSRATAANGKKSVCFGGTVAKVSIGEYSCRIFLKNCTVNGRRIINNIIIEAESLGTGTEYEGKNEAFERGDYVEGEGILGRAALPENPGQFDMRAYYKALGYIYYVKNPEFTSWRQNRNPVIAALEGIKGHLKQVYESCCEPRDAGVFEAVVLGDKAGMDGSLSELFSAGGIGHILAISGVKTLKLDIPLVPETRINWAFVPLHIAIIYILKLCLDEEIIPRCRFPCSRGYFTKFINRQKKQ